MVETHRMRLYNGQNDVLSLRMNKPTFGGKAGLPDYQFRSANLLVSRQRRDQVRFLSDGWRANPPLADKTLSEFGSIGMAFLYIFCRGVLQYAPPIFSIFCWHKVCSFNIFSLC